MSGSTPTPHSLAAVNHPEAAGQRRREIKAMFDVVAPRYDVMNDLLSGGIHRLWKRRLAALAGPAPAAGLAVDLAGGTGDVARLLTRRGWRVVVCDPSEGMMAVGRQRLAGSATAWVAGQGEDLPLANNSVDLLTVAFGLRNMGDPIAALAEGLRVLAPGGRLICLEFSRPWRPIAPFYDAYSEYCIPRLGAMVAGRREAYRYLVDSIRAFPNQKDLKKRMEDVGYSEVFYENLSFGIAALHMGHKPPMD